MCWFEVRDVGEWAFWPSTASRLHMIPRSTIGRYSKTFEMMNC